MGLYRKSSWRDSLGTSNSETLREQTFDSKVRIERDALSARACACISCLKGQTARGTAPMIIAGGNLSGVGELSLSLSRARAQGEFHLRLCARRNELEFIAARNVCPGARLSSEIKLDLTPFCFHAES